MADLPSTIAEAMRAAGLDAREASILLQSVLGVEAAYLIAHPEASIGRAQGEAFVLLAARRRSGEPIAYLTGTREFYGRRFQVSPAVLVPRPETELLVEVALERLALDAAPTILDLGTGSGNIAVTLALERPRAKVTATDASVDALAIARANVEAHAAANVRLLAGDLFAAVDDARFDVIVSNPPYVALADPHLQQGDVRFEPRDALVAGADGLACLRRIVGGAAAHLHPGGWLLFEHGYDQAGACAALLEEAGYFDFFTARDLAGLPRVSGARSGTDH